MPRKSWKGNITLTGYVVFGLLIIGFFVGLAAPEVAPTSPIGQWIAKYGTVIYFAWALMATTILGIILGLLGYPLKTDDAA